MSGTNSITGLPAPVFLTDADGLDPNLILADMIAAFQNEAGRTLYPAQVERLLINLYAYREALVRNAIQYTGQQNLLAYASYPMIDYLGQLVGVTRQTAIPATCTLQFTLTYALTVAYSIPEGTQAGTSDGSFVFATTALLAIPQGAVSGTVQAACTTAGGAGNGYLPGQVNVLVGGNALVASVANTTTTSGGADQETDNHLRTRIQAAPNQFSTAGPTGAYRYWAISADPSVVDALVVSPSPGQVSVYVLTGPVSVQPAPSPNTIGIASPAVLAEVSNALNASTVRPLCDTVTVYPVAEVDYSVTATVTLFANADPTSTIAAANAAAIALATSLASAIQQDVVPSQWIAALSVFGVYEVTLSISAAIDGQALTPAADSRFVLQPGQWANCVGITITQQIGSEMELP